MTNPGYPTNPGFAPQYNEPLPVQQPAPQKKGPGAGTVVAISLITSLVAGLGGGFIGASLAGDDSSVGASNNTMRWKRP